MVTKKKLGVTVELYAPFARYRTDLLRIETRCFQHQGDDEGELEVMVKTSLFMAVIKDEDKAFGYCLVTRRWPESPYINYTAIDPDYQDKHHLGTLVGAVEAELLKCGFTHIERNCRINNGYADKVQKHYGSRVEVMYDHGSLLGPLRFFRIRLESADAVAAPPELKTSAEPAS